ncbi:MAG: ATP-binding protein [Cyanobacterium sp. T60_A2020_053]|nr:ATP-binding protein [Cyanobacterium sp. T60_A2020_053]
MEVFKQTSFIVNSDLVCLAEVLNQYETLKIDDISRQHWLECQLALAEGFTNAVRHAHKNKPKETAIEIYISVTPTSITIKIWDSGQPFNLIAFRELMGKKQDQLNTGGRGIEIIAKIADELSYERTSDQRNCLVMKKNFASVSL